MRKFDNNSIFNIQIFLLYKCSDILQSWLYFLLVVQKNNLQFQDKINLQILWDIAALWLYTLCKHKMRISVSPLDKCLSNRCNSLLFFLFVSFSFICYHKRRRSTPLHIMQVKAVSPCTALHVICNRKHFVNTRDDAWSRDCIAWPMMRVLSIVGQTREYLLANTTVYWSSI